ncbi:MULTISPECIES: energy transducer TonB [Polaribacter]|uniref:Energy transducer TonB n=1 Tax=Polaribacter sejongensis TaxID=985043 RepID=A0AAJ1VI01_9FLAO|nr:MULTISPECIES: energy transducer TonB [Polaribacter]AUC21441.1 energy transducer TonB [Polaribacter sejongensis]MDN3620834.1 energy transducer TonB [Polaribacter undariae]UWD30968.1 energy transducer TonB [Polaribacter undariae]
MEIKKNPKSNLENYSKIFMQIGLVLALFVTYAAIENKTYDKVIGDLGTVSMNADMEEETVITEKIEPIKPKTPPPPAPEKIEIVEDEEEVEETVIESTETDETEAVEVEEIVEIQEVEEVVEDVSFMIIEDVPVFPGCKGSKNELKACFSKMVQKHFSRKFDANLPNELGLSSGRKRVFIGFKIDKNGNIVDVNARAPHPKIKSEVISVMKKLPKMKPGRQRGKPVGVKYSIPFTLIVE